MMTEIDRATLYAAAKSIAEGDDIDLVDVIPDKLDEAFWSYFGGAPDGVLYTDVISPEWNELKVLMILLFLEVEE